VVAEEAFQLAVALGDTLRAARAGRRALIGLFRYGGPPIITTPAFRTWTERADRYAPPGSVERVYADVAEGRRQQEAGDLNRAWELKQSALELARRLGDPNALFHVAFFSIRPQDAPLRQRDRLRLAEEFFAHSRDGVSAREAGMVLWACGVVLLDWGQRPRSEEALQQLRALAERARDPLLPVYVATHEAWLLLVDGRLEAALERAERVAAMCAEAGSAVLARTQSDIARFRPLLHPGSFAEALKTMGRAGEMAGSETTSAAVAARRALALVHLGQQTERERLWQGLWPKTGWGRRTTVGLSCRS
jgi:tetratricopeptide (TPR) repeat protein